MEPKDLTLVSCNYDTPDEMELMRRSLLSKSPEMAACPFILVENSPNERSAERWREFGWTFLDNRAGDTRHAYSLKLAMKHVRTKYVLVVDSDVEFLENPWPVVATWAAEGGVLCGCVMSDVPQDGEIIHLCPRVKPWFCLVDAEYIKVHDLPFHDAAREKSGSEIIYGHRPIVDTKDLRPLGNSAENPWYDVGATLYEDVARLGGRIIDEDFEGKTFRHFGGMSYRAVGSRRAEVRKALQALTGASRPLSLKVATRYHTGRETLFKRLLTSLQGQAVEMVASYVTDEEEKFLRQQGVERLVKVEPNEGCKFNGYINSICDAIGDAWVWVLDSDDIAYPNAAETIRSAPLDFTAVNVFNIHYTPNKMRLPILSNTYGSGLTISSQCLVWNPLFVTTRWRDDVYEADNRFLAQAMREGFKRVWHNHTEPVAWLDVNRFGKS